MIEAIQTLVLFIVFVCFAAWVWSPAQKARFEEASWLPLREEDPAPVHAPAGDGGTSRD